MLNNVKLSCYFRQNITKKFITINFNVMRKLLYYVKNIDKF